MEDIYEELLKDQLANNVDAVWQLLDENDPDLLKKIKKYAEKYGMEEEYIHEAIRNKNQFAINAFAKDPKKQNIYEKGAAALIRKIPGVQDFKNYGNNELHLINGIVKRKQDIEGEYPDPKTIDFGLRYNNKQVYISHKYTNETGGAQGNQYKDLQMFIKSARDNKKEDVVFIAIADGPFYQKYDSKAKMKKIDNLKRMCTPIVKVCTIYDLEATLKSL